MIAEPRATEHKDLPALAKFLIRVYKFDPSDAHADERLLAWKYLRPRPGWQGSRSYVLEKDGQIVAHCGVWPMVFRRPEGETVRSLTLMDWAADPASPGVGVALFRKLMEMAPTSFVIGGAPATRKIIPRIGFQQVGHAGTYAAWLRPWREFRMRRRTTRSALRLFHGLLHDLLNPARALDSPIEGWEAIAVDEFDNSLLPILSGSRRSWTFCQRTPADLNYLLECPHGRWRGFLLKRHGKLAGYFILGRVEWETRLLDLVVDSADAKDWNIACAIVTQAARLDPEACRIRALATVPILALALLHNRYWLQGEEPINLHDPNAALAGAFPVGFQLADGDSGF